MQLFPGQQFVITGDFVGISRATLRNRIEAEGGIVTDQLSGKTFVLLAGTGAAEETISKAAELGVFVVTEPELDGVFPPPERASAECKPPSANDGPAAERFALGGANGEAFELDLTTGAISGRSGDGHSLEVSSKEATRRPRPRVAFPTGFLAEDAVNAVTLGALFSRACYRTSFDSDGDLRIDTDAGRVVVLIDQGRRVIRLVTHFLLKEYADEGAKLAFVNRMNQAFVFARFTLGSPTRLMTDYTVPFDQGIGAFPLVAVTRRFASSVAGALRTCDEEGVLE